MRRTLIILSPLLIAMLLPIWTIWYIGPWEATGERGFIWWVLYMLPYNVRQTGATDFVLQYAIPNLVQGATLLLVGIGIDRHLLLRRGRGLTLCPTCGYDLRATPDRCPECGSIPEPAATATVAR